jgi:predicted DNA-binding transcriptional regulator AlpA
MTPLLKAEDIATILQVAPRVVSEIYAMRSDFPTPIRLPSEKGQGRYRWKREEVMEWIESLKEAR